jgi:hypothetical protein
MGQPFNPRRTGSHGITPLRSRKKVHMLWDARPAERLARSRNSRNEGYNRSYKWQCPLLRKYGTRQQGGAQEDRETVKSAYETGSRNKGKM